MIELDRIEVKPQARTEFDDITIQELASDIEANGLLQPVLVSPIGDEKYRLICGERRLRAIRKLGQKHIPALVSKVANSNALAIQLAENIQRENMTLNDLAHAVKQLFDELKQLDAVAIKVGKSKAWVCKHLAAATDYGWRTKVVLEEGACEDIDMLGTLAKIEEIGTWHTMSKALELLKAGKFTRQQARDWLKEIKAGRDPSLTPEEVQKEQERIKKMEANRKKEEAERVEKRKAQAAEQKAIESGTDERFIEWAMNELDYLMLNEDTRPTEYLNKLRQDQRDALQLHLVELAQANKGEKALTFWTEQLLASRYDLREKNMLCNNLELMAVIVGMLGQKPDLFALITLAEIKAREGLE